ncbi:SAM-dependent methyltransferase [Paraburkholderia caballeronis]|uniref:SAM-dependent methyltransferase n=1 Tax=Paraburkholderia caballeronis TaxID=416943 RepID=UPI0010656BFF|nr:SAM-dependent methyltransferase [Paraburkholderia caballeronis]TDV19571.1 nodulation protein S (NodS) [Paraburkholderia caballeronis]TDV22171.1 nodulation protein S (NodS) [Paraburkholderia caballeronis]TDV29075.1 nodulation protein S (NodS) [Paraburkholderia caballeronis]
MVSLTTAARARYFDAKFAADDDPWRYRDSWYERRKRDLVLAALPHARYRSAFEPGCANGELSAHLAPRCERLLSADFAPTALALAQRRVARFAHVSVERRAMPDDWPASRFDLIVISEFAYYLSREQCATLADLGCASLEAGGTLLCCHWRHGGEAWMLDPADVHARFDARDALHRHTRIEDRDFLLDVWTRETDTPPLPPPEHDA